MSSKMEKFIVAAIGLGTNYSAYAFSLKHEYEKDPTIVRINPGWASGNCLYLKQPTCVLCKPNGEFDSFGYEAENRYRDLSEDNEHQKWYFFQRFKMLLHVEQVKVGIDIIDDKGLKMPAKKVFGMAIRYLKDHLLDMSEKRGTGVKVDDVHWVLPVPATWTVSAKEFMREAAIEAGIDRGRLTIALDSEAAAMYCQMLRTDQFSTEDKLFRDTKYIVIDLGDERVNITAHENESDGTIKVVYTISNRSMGGTKMNQDFNQMFITIVGAPMFKKFCDEYKDDYIEMLREFELKKRSVRTDNNDKITLPIPIALQNTYEKTSLKRIQDAVDQTPYRGKLQWTAGKMRLDADLFRSLFQNTVNKITKYLADVLENPYVKGTSTFLMVGGLSECQVMQEAMKRAFPCIKIICPRDAGVAVLFGAVMFGHRPIGASKQDEDEISSDDIANLSTCSNTYERGIRQYNSLSEEEDTFSSRQNKGTTALETKLENQMTLKADVKRAPSDDELFILSRKLDKFHEGWWLLAKLLGLSDETIDEMEHGGGDIVRRYYKLLTAWKRQNAEQEKGSVGYLLRQCNEAGIDRQVTVDVFGK